MSSRSHPARKARRTRNPRSEGPSSPNDSETASPVPELEDPVHDATSTDLGVDAAGILAGAAAVAAVTATQADTEALLEPPTKEPEADEDFAWAPSTKKSKKDKKKRKSLAWADEEVSTPATQDSDVVPIDETVAGVTEGLQGVEPVDEPAIVSEAIAVDDLSETVKPTEIEEPITPFGEPGTRAVELEEPTVITEPVAAEEAEEFAWAPATKKTKKDKKKKRASTFAFDEPAEETSTLEPEAEVIKPDDIAMPSTDVATTGTGDEVVVNPVFEPAVTDPWLEPETASREITMEDAMPTPVEPEQEEDWGFSTKKSKKDKKKKRASTFALDDDADVTSIPGTEIPVVAEPIQEAEPQIVPDVIPKDLDMEEVPAAIVEPDADWGFAPTTKKSKKDKKKKRASTFDLGDEDVSTPGAQTPVVEPEPLAEVQPEIKPESVPEETFAEEVPVETPIVAADEPEADWGFSSKKSKKDKKKKRASAFDLGDEDLSTPGTQTPAEQAVAEIEPEITTKDMPAGELPMEAATEPSLEAAIEPDADWGFSTKKSKKDKKKKRASAFDFDEPEETSTLEPEIPAEQPAIEIEPETTTKDISTEEIPIATAVEPDADWGFSTKSKKDKKKKRATFDLDDTEDLSTPGTETPVVEAPTDETVDTPAAEVVEDEWAPATKKSKRDKKKKRGSTFALDDMTPAETDTIEESKNVEMTQEPEMLELALQPSIGHELDETFAPVGPESLQEPFEKSIDAQSVQQNVEPVADTEGTSETRDVVREAADAEAVHPDSITEAASQVEETSRDLDPEPEPEAWGFSSKKSKKDKKKKRGSAFALDDIPQSGVEESVSVIGPEVTKPIPEPETIQTQVYPEPEPEPEAWGFSTKKSKKDKKKRKSIPGAFADEEGSGSVTPATPLETDVPVLGATVPEESRIEEITQEMNDQDRPVESYDTIVRDVPMSDAPVSTATEVPPTISDDGAAAVPEDDWGFSTTKSKKDKKKKRQSTLNEVSTAEDSSFTPTPAEPDFNDSTTDAPAFDSQRGYEQDQPKPDSEDMTEAEAPIDWANDPWGTTTKKSKKDKKKKKQSMSEETGTLPADSETSRNIGIPEPELPSSQEKAAYLVAMAFGEDRKARSRSRSRSREALPTSVEVPTETSVVVEPEIRDTTVPAEVEEDWGFATKKSKKDKKKKRQSTFDESKETSNSEAADAMAREAFSMGEEPSATPASFEEPISRELQPSTELRMLDGEAAHDAAPHPRDVPSPVEVKEIGDYEFGRTSPTSYKASAAEPELAPHQTTKELKEEPVQDEAEAPREAAEVDDWYFPANKSKKDKKKKKRQSAFEDVSTEGERSAEVSAIPTDENTIPAAYAAAVAEPVLEEEWTAGGKKSKKDKKKKKAAFQWEDEPEATPRSSGTVDEPQTREIAEDSDMRDRSSSLKDPVEMSESPAGDRFVPGGFDSEIPPMAPEPPSAIYEPSQREVDEPTPAPEDEFYSTTKKGKKSKKDKKAKRAPTLDYEESSSARNTTVSAREAADYPTRSQDAEVVRLDDSDGSNVSESTRERRRRRRSPQAYDGEELPDLPRNRALTPPPENDDIMDTALGIAAGLGFGASEGERAPRPKPPTPTKPRGEEPSWSFDKVAPGVSREIHDGNRDSAIQADSPILGSGHPAIARDSGYVPSPATRHSWDEGHPQQDEYEDHRPARPQSPTSSTEDVSTRQFLETPARGQPSAIESTTKDRSSVVFKSSPAAPSPYTPHLDTSMARDSPTDIHRSPSIHGHHASREQLRSSSPLSQPRRTSDSLASNLIDRASATSVDRAVFSPTPHSNMSGPLSPPKSPLHSIPEHRPSNDFATAAALGAAGIGAAALLSRDSTGSPTGARTLGRSKSRTSSLRNLRGSLTSPTPYDPRDIDSGRSSRGFDESGSGKAPATSFFSARDVQGGGAGGMADVFVCSRPEVNATLTDGHFQDGYGAYPGTPTSPTRPPSITKRRSMQQITDLQTRVEQLASENRMLAEAKIVAERHLEEFHLDRNRAEYATEEALREAEMKVQERDEEIEKLKQDVDEMVAQHEENSRSMGVGTAAGLAGAAGLAAGAVAGSSWDEDKQELEDLRNQHRELSTGVDEIVSREVDSAVAEKSAEIERLQNDLTQAKQRIKELQSQILKERSQSGGNSIIVFHDEDYFDQKCQDLCQHVQGWVLRFSKFSDSRVCRSTNEVRDEKVVDRFDNAILDGSDVDTYLGDRVKRRDVFMSVVMTMIWEYVFTRYLFGMDRDQRQKLKQLEKNLGEVGTKSQIGQWRAMTLTLLSRRDGFKNQCESDTDAVSYEILGTLSKFLPPPANLQEQILESLRSVLRLAVGVSVEMRCQSAEYIMLPPLQPEYDTNGDLVRKVFFNASLMNERSGETNSNEELQEQGAVVRVVLFPLVVKKGNTDEDDDEDDEEGANEEEIVVCPAQVLVARVDKGKKAKRSSSGKQSGRVASGRSEAAISTASLGAMSGVEMGENVI